MILGVGLSAVPAASQDRGSFYVGGSFSLYDATIIDQFTRYRRGNIITGNLFCFVNFSVERGRFQFSKEGTSTAYDIDIPVMGYGFGMGVGYHVFSCLTVRLNYQFNQYGTTEISATVGALGRKVDVIELLPRYDFVMLSVQYNFGSSK